MLHQTEASVAILKHVQIICANIDLKASKNLLTNRLTFWLAAFGKMLKKELK